MDKDFFGGFQALDALSQSIGTGHTEQGGGRTEIKDRNIVSPSSITGEEYDEYGNLLDEDGNPVPPKKTASQENIPDPKKKEKGDNGEPILDPEDVFGTTGEEEEEEDETKKKAPKKPEIEEEEEEEEDEPKKKKKPKTANTEEEDELGLGEYEPDMAAIMQERLFDRFNMPITDETEAFESMDDVANFVYDTIDKYSIPEFANPEVEAIDKYVRDGGRLEDYMQAVHTGLDLENLDLTNEAHQKAVIREDLKNQGLSEVRIKKRIERLEDAGLLEEEAEESTEAVRDFRQAASETLLQNQENARKEQQKANEKYLRNVQNELKNTGEILGVKFTDKAKRDTYNFIFTPEEDGLTPMQKSMNSSVKTLLEVAYFLQNGGKLSQAMEKKASSTATKKLKDKLANKKRGRNQSTTSRTDDDAWGAFSRQLRQF